MKLLNTKIDGPKIIKTKIFKDQRGFLKEIYQKRIISKLDFCFDVMSYSKKNVLRGLHIQTKKPQAKIITVTNGEILDIAVDLRKKSKTFGKIFKIILSDKNCKSIYIPEGFAHGFCSLTDDTLLLYSCTKYRNAKTEIGIKYNDKDLKIKWPIKKPIVSHKDHNALDFKEYLKKYSK